MPSFKKRERSPEAKPDPYFAIGFKNSLDKNYLRWAEESGCVDVLTLHVVTDIQELPGHRYAVICHQIDTGGNVLKTKTFVTKRLFLGAGSLGTSKLLVKAKAKGTLSRLNDAVGKYWASDGDTFPIRGGSGHTNPSQGGPGATVIEDHDNPIAPTALVPAGQWNETIDGRTYYIGVGFSPTSGYFAYDGATDTVKLNYDFTTAQAMKSQQATMRTCERLNTANTVDGNTPFTVAVGVGASAHPLGGATLGAACDLYGRVKNYRGLYVTDGALVPGNAGAVNPSFTIAALAERCMDGILD